jgi:deoxyribonuclease IV
MSDRSDVDSVPPGSRLYEKTAFERPRIYGQRRAFSFPVMGQLRFGPARVPSRESPEAAIALLRERGYTASEIDFASGFWMDYAWAEEFGKLARRRRIALSVHAPIAGFMGHVERDRKHGMAVGMLDHSAGIAKAAGAEVVVFHPGFLLGRERKDAIASVIEQLAELRERLEEKGRDVDFGVEIMGRVRELGSAEDVFAISRALPWVRPVIDFAHLHAVTDGAFTTVKAFHDVLTEANRILPRGAPFHIHFSDIAYANRNETKHLPYGDGTLRAEPLREALARFDRPATVISESPDEQSTQAIREVLYTGSGSSASE